MIIEDDDTIRNGYSYLIDNMEGYSVISNYASYEEAARKIRDDVPDVILLDISLPGLDGIGAIEKLKKILPEVIIIMVTVNENPELILKALSNGAMGYLTKNINPVQIVQAIKEAMEGGGPLSPNVARLVIRSFQKNHDSPLTKREGEILQLVADGQSRTQIAKELFIDLETVKTHIKNIYLKLNVHTRSEAIKMGRENRLIK
jgi:DNA-binding NarL/FixJ family response regulator